MNGKKMLSQYVARCCQGSVRQGYDGLMSMGGKPAYVRDFAERVRRRFFTPHPKLDIPSEDSLVRSVVSAFHRYYIQVLGEHEEGEVAEKELLERLHGILGLRQEGGNDETLHEALREALLDRGLHSSFGRTSPHLCLYLWGNERIRVYDVSLPLTKRRVSVHFMDRFITAGWLHFATHGRAQAGGWATADGLYCVRSKYDLRSESFRVNYLKHEAQHFDDYERFPALAGSCLEYRAKLVELIHASTASPLKWFLLESATPDGSPHARAAARIVTGLSEHLALAHAEHLNRVPYEKVRAIARRLFDEDTRQRRDASCSAP